MQSQDRLERNNEILRNGIINKAVGGLQLYQLSYPQMLGVFVLFGLFVVMLLLQIPFITAAFILVVLIASFLLWGGSDFTNQVEKSLSVKEYYSEAPDADESKPIPPAIFVGKTYSLSRKRKKLHKIERHLALRGYVSYDEFPSQPGAYILTAPSTKLFKSGDSDVSGSKYDIGFAFKLSGIPGSLSDDEAMSYLNKISDLFKAQSQNEYKFYWHSSSTSSEYCEHQQNLMNLGQDALSKQLLKGRVQRANVLAQNGELGLSDLYLYVRTSVTLGAYDTVNQNFRDKFMAAVIPRFQYFLKIARMEEQADPEELWLAALSTAYRNVYSSVLKHLSGKGPSQMGMEVTPLNVHEMFQRDWDELHAETYDKCPRYTSITSSGLEYKKIGDPEDTAHISGILYCPDEKPDGSLVASTPVFSQDAYYCPSKKKWRGCIRLNQIEAIPATEDGSYARGHLMFLYKKLAGIRDFTLITEQVSIPHIAQYKKIKEGIISREKRAGWSAKSGRGFDSFNQRELDDLLDASDSLAEGELTSNVATVVWLERDTQEELLADLGTLSLDKFSGGVAEVNQSMTEARYFESLSYSWTSLLFTHFSRRTSYLLKQCIPFLPFIQPQEIHDEGILFTGADVASAYYIDFVKRKNHSGIFGKTGAGKTMILFEIVLECVFNKIPCMIRDSPRGTGESSFTPLLNALKLMGFPCEYYDIRKAETNVLSFPPGVPLSEDITRNHIDILQAIVMGLSYGSEKADAVLTVLESSHHEFFKTIDYNTDIPILEDFLNFLKDGYKAEPEEEDALNFIKMRLKSCIRSPWGKKLNTQKTFNRDLLVLCIGLTNAKGESRETLVYSLLSAHIVDDMAARHTRVVEINDECSTTIRFPAVAAQIQRRCSEGRKMGVNVILAATDMKAIWESAFASTIIANLDTIMVTNVNSGDRDAFCEKVNFKYNLLRNYNKAPELRKLRTSWYCLRTNGDQHIQLYYNVAPLTLAIGANDPWETNAREAIAKHYEDPIQGFVAFGYRMTEAYSQGWSAEDIITEPMPVGGKS